MNAEDKKVLKVISFNSMIVRLKVFWKSAKSYFANLFQFYDSPIKRTDKNVIAVKESAVSILW